MELTALKATLREVITELCPHDLELFEIEADKILEEAIDGQSSVPIRGDVQPRFSLHEIKEFATIAFDYLKVMAATLQALKEIGFLKSRPPISAENLAELRNKWASELRKVGLDEEKSIVVAVRFSDDLLRAIGGPKK